MACRGRIWLQKNGATFLGTGRVVLLERIREHGSIAKAARSMEMSYKHAWDLVDSMNRQAGEPMVVTSKGGRGGGGTRLTECGEKAIAAFWALQERFHRFLEAETSELDL
ncbi:ModE family transcriptional regulator [Desulfolithobacter dissulfuricans]|uniref:ModE family transcriptional regulator n=1 Tax=Desulfolithobacter dissulfuricans TaxID=2795293 RepID=A0A915XLU3_9BACT|nr:ModE family transcriptional regulator [Desulfolithobacter dissulfuricans]